MIHLVYGTDRPKIKKRIDEILKNFSDIFWITSDQFSRSKIDELVGARGLFSPKYVVVCDRLFEGKDITTYFQNKLKDIGGSPNTFIFAEGELEKKNLDLFKKFADKVEVLSEVGPLQDWRGPTSDNFNLFSICDALGEKNRKNLWILYSKALLAGIEPEQIFWKLVWQVRNLILTKKAVGGVKELVERLKMSPFVASKTERYAKNWTLPELLGLYKDLLNIYHNARRGVVDMETAIEKLILK